MNSALVPVSVATIALALACAASAASGVGCMAKDGGGGRLGHSEALIRTARDVGAEGVPEAAQHLAMARHQLAQARRYLDAGEHDEASRLLARADADAQAAFAITREAHLKTTAEETAARIREGIGIHASSAEPSSEPEEKP